MTPQEFNVKGKINQFFVGLTPEGILEAVALFPKTKKTSTCLEIDSICLLCIEEGKHITNCLYKKDKRGGNVSRHMKDLHKRKGMKYDENIGIKVEAIIDFADKVFCKHPEKQSVITSDGKVSWSSVSVTDLEVLDSVVFSIKGILFL